MKNKFNIQLPFFPGFYESILFNSDTLYYEFEGDNLDGYREQFNDVELTSDDLDIDYPRFKDEVSRLFVDKFKSMIDELFPDLVKELTFTELNSPMYYNYRTDWIFTDLTLAEDWRTIFINFLEKERDVLEKRVYDDWTSCDGFMSYLENDYDFWIEEMKKDEPDSRYVGVVLQYLMEILYDRFKKPLSDYNVGDAITIDTYEDFYIGEYVICTKNMITKNNTLS